MTSAHPRELSDKHRLRGEISVGTRGGLRLESDNSGMARAFKELTGNITKLNDPHFVAARGLWVMMVKENDRWIAINSRDEQKIRSYHALLTTRKTANTLNISVQATTLTQERVKMAEYAYGILGETHPKELVDAAQLHCQQKLKRQAPTVIAALQLFYAKQEKRQLSEFTMRDYQRLVKHLSAEFPTQHLGELTAADLNRFIEQPTYLAGKRSRYIYVKAFIQFCAGKHNHHCNGQPWLSPHLLQWQPPKVEAKEITVYTYAEIVELLKIAQRTHVLPYFIFRLFSLMRTEEMKRFIAIHPTVNSHPLISLEAKRISITNQIFKKRSDTNHRGRFYNHIHPTFMAWLEYFQLHQLSLNCGEDRYHALRQAVSTDKRNTLRHTAITYHCLAFKNPMQTAYIAGNSVGIIQNHYLNMNVPESDALKLYELTPTKASQLGIL